MTKRKSNAGKANQLNKAHALQRLKSTCDQLVGPGYFEKFSPSCKLNLATGRFPALKLKITPGPGMSEDTAQLMSEIFSDHLNKLTAATASGEQLQLGIYLREALTLIFYVQFMEEQVPNRQKLKAAFSAYDTDSELMIEVVTMAVDLMHRLSMICSNWSTALFSYSIDHTAAFSKIGFSNHITAVMQKPESCSAEINGHKREILRVGWTDYEGKIIYLNLMPGQVGLEDGLPQESKKLYIQRHALNRLDERLGVLEGLTHFHLYDQFRSGKLRFKSQGQSSLIEFSLFDRKLGYLVCCLHEDKIIIRTFLFLTNDGTPQGKKLAGLTNLELLDKQYLGIDTLEGFLKFGIAEDPQLTALFIQAGCADLLELSEVKKFYNAEVKSKDPAVLLQYLMGKSQQEPNIYSAKGEDQVNRKIIW